MAVLRSPAVRSRCKKKKPKLYWLFHIKHKVNQKKMNNLSLFWLKLWCEGECKQPGRVKKQGGSSSGAKQYTKAGEFKGTYLLESKPMKHKQTRRMSTNKYYKNCMCQNFLVSTFNLSLLYLKVLQIQSTRGPFSSGWLLWSIDYSSLNKSNVWYHMDARTKFQ